MENCACFFIAVFQNSAAAAGSPAQLKNADGDALLLDVDSGMINSYQYEMKEKRRERRMKVLVIGGGAAGLMAAGAALRQGHEVTVLEHMEKPAQKILVTGKGRCNVTNDCTAEEFLHHVRTNPRFLFSSLGAFPPARTMELFESLGVELKVERGRRVFPVSDKAEEIRQALLR